MTSMRTRCDLAPATENIDMSTPRQKATIPFGAFRSVITIGLLAGIAGTAGAQTGFCTGTIDFCDVENGHPKWYDNTNVSGQLNTGQTYGCFTDVDHSGWRPPTLPATWRPPEISVYQGMAWLDTTVSQPYPPSAYHSGTNPWGDSAYKPQRCGLNFYGNSLLTSNNHAEMWATIVQPPGGTMPMYDSWGLTATVWFDNVTGPPNPRGSGGWNNQKAVGIITNYNPSNKTGLFLGLFDAGNTEFLCLQQFDLSPQPPSNMNNPTTILCKQLAVSSILSTGDGGSSTQSYGYVVTLSISTPVNAGSPSGRSLSAHASVWPANSPYRNQQAQNRFSCPDSYAPDQQCLDYTGNLPSGILGAGGVGLATLAPTSGSGIVDTYISRFTIAPGSTSD